VHRGPHWLRNIHRGSVHILRLHIPLVTLGLRVNHDSYHPITLLANRSRLSAFTGTWVGHDCGARVNAGRITRERISLGCSPLNLGLTMSLHHPPLRGAKPLTIARLSQANTDSGCTEKPIHEPPSVRQVGQIKRDYDVITESSSDTSCRDEAARRGACGA